MLTENQTKGIAWESRKTNPNVLFLLRDILALSHIFNTISSACGVAIGYWVTVWYHHTSMDSSHVLLAAFATAFISSGGFIVNDIIDLEIDRINRPDRPLVVGRMSVASAQVLYVAYNLLGVFLALATNLAVGVVAVAIALALFLYSYKLKRRFLVGHLVIATLGAMLLPFGGIAAGHLTPTIYTVPVVFLSFFAREILKTIPDVEGDRSNQVVNVSTRFGPHRAVQISRIILVVVVLLLPAIRLVWPLNQWFLPLVVLFIWPLSFLSLFGGMAHPTDSRSIKRLLRISKLLFLFTAMAFFIGSLSY